jgi:hypothetical protein
MLAYIIHIISSNLKKYNTRPENTSMMKNTWKGTI